MDTMGRNMNNDMAHVVHPTSQEQVEQKLKEGRMVGCVSQRIYSDLVRPVAAKLGAAQDDIWAGPGTTLWHRAWLPKEAT